MIIYIITYILLTLLTVVAILIFVPPFKSLRKINRGEVWAATYEGGLTHLLKIITLWLTIGGKISTENKDRQVVVTIQGIGITLNHAMVYCITTLPGIIISTCMYWIIVFLCSNLFKTDFESIPILSDSIFWLGITCYFAYLSARNYTKTVKIDWQSAQRLTVHGQGIVREVVNFSHGSDGPVILEYAMLTEGTYRVPSFVSVSDGKVSLVPIQFETRKITLMVKDRVQFEWAFSEVFKVCKPGIYFAADSGNAGAIEYKKSVLEDALRGLARSINSDVIFATTTEEIRKILAPSFDESGETNEKYWIKNLREKIHRSKLDDFEVQNKLKGTFESIQSILIKSGAWENPTVFYQFKSAISDYVGIVSESNQKLGVITIDINKKEMNYSTKETRAVAEERVLTHFRQAAYKLELEWLIEQVNQLVNDWSEHNITFEDAIECIQIQFGKRVGMNIDGRYAKNVRPIINLNSKSK